MTYGGESGVVAKPVVLSLVLGGFLVVTIIFCRLFILCREWKAKKSNPNTNGNLGVSSRPVGSGSVAVCAIGSPPCYDNLEFKAYYINVAKDPKNAVDSKTRGYIDGQSAPPPYDAIIRQEESFSAIDTLPEVITSKESVESST